MPLPDGSFDVVFCDHGAMTFADPYRDGARGGAAPPARRASRVLALDAARDVLLGRRGGHDRAAARLALLRDAPLRRAPDEPVEFNLPYGEWIRLFREHGFRVETLLEVQPPEDAESTYRTPEETEWARSWPMEEIWRLTTRSRPGTARSCATSVWRKS